MHTDQQPHAPHLTSDELCGRHAIGLRSHLAAGLVLLAAIGTGPDVGVESHDTVLAGGVPVAATAGHGDARRNPVDPEPDAVAGYAGGIAARVRLDDGTDVPGDLFMLMATTGSTASARLFDTTPFTHGNGQHTDTVESNRIAEATAEQLVGTDIAPAGFTTAPGGGPSGGLVYLITYLDLLTDGGFTGDLRVAATGELVDEGYLEPVTAPNEKLPAARLAGADVLFTTAVPSHAALAEHADRSVGQRFRSRHGAVTLDVERGLDDYADWGGDRPDGLDVVVVGHVADVASYLCGTGSDIACGIRDRLADTVTSDELTEFDLVRLGDTATEDDVDPVGAGWR